MQAREADSEGFIERDGVRIHYEVHGSGPTTILLLPTWTIIHKRFWKTQLPYLARHFRVVTYDGPGNGRSDRSVDPRAYDRDAQVRYMLDVLDATATERAVVVGLSVAPVWALRLAAHHPGRVAGLIFIAPSVDVSDGHVRPPPAGGPATLPPSRVPHNEADPDTHWAKANPGYWNEHFEDFLWFFFGKCFPEPHSTKPIEDAVSWGLHTAPATLTASVQVKNTTRQEAEELCRAVTCPVLCIHGDEDALSPVSRSKRIAELTGGDYVIIEGGGHVPVARDPVKINHLIRDFVERVAPVPKRATFTRARNRRRKKVLYLSSPIGLGHARRDVAIAKALKQRHDGIQIDWLAQHPVTRVLEDVGETVHPASAFLASESRHVESESGEHDLHCFEALRRMDEILVHNFHVFDDVVRDGGYDMVVGDEAWDVDHFLHENPDLKRYAYVWLTDFVGMLPMPAGGEREALVTADYNAEMIAHIERYPWIRDRSIFVGNPSDIVGQPFGKDLPMIREWTEQHYDFSGYITGIDLRSIADRSKLRRDLGWQEGERVCVVSVGGSGVGEHLVHRVADAFEAARARVDGLRMVVVTGPRIDASRIQPRAGLEVHGYVSDLYRQLAACDLAVVQGGLTTTMELAAAGRPFLYVPLRHHFEQNFHVAHRLDQYGAGTRLEYDALTPDSLADAIAKAIRTEAAYKPVETDGAERAAKLISELV